MLSTWAGHVLSLGGGGSPPVPALTSSDTLAVTSGQLLSETVTTNTSCYCYLEGEDGMSFELIGSQPGTSWTLRKLNNETFDFDTPEDFNQDNIYDVTLALGPLAGGADILVPITVTVEALTLTVGTFTAQTGVTPSTPTESNVITVTALNVPSVTVTAEAGLEYQKNGGAWTSAAGTAALNDTFKARLTSSPSYLTLVEYDLTFNGNVVRTFSVTTQADPAAATFTEVASQPANQNKGFASNTATFSVTFPAGNPVIYVAPQAAGRIITGVTVNAVSCTEVVASTSGLDMGLFVCPTAVAAGAYDVVVTVDIAQAWFGIMCGVLNNVASLTPNTVARKNESSAGTHTTDSALTISAGGVGVAFGVHMGTAPRTADNGTLISTGIAAGYNGSGGTGDYGMISRNITAGSWTPSFSAAGGNLGYILAATWEAV